MSANTETTGADRTKCKDWCGKAYGARGVPFRRSCGFPMYFEHGADFNVAVKDDEPTWCSPACRDARLPPIAAPDFEHQALCPVERGGSCNCVPIAAPAAHIERRKGHDMRPVTMLQPGPASSEMIKQLQKNIDDAYRLMATPRWLVPAGALADAPPEPAKCEPWCGNGLPPDDVCGYGFIDGPGDEREYFKLPGKSQRRKGYVYSWCSNECREKAIAPKSPPAHKAPKAAPEQFWFTDDEGEKIGPFATGLEADDASVTYGAWMRTQTGAPYAGPERLPKPQLAADWVEDCIGDVR